MSETPDKPVGLIERYEAWRCRRRGGAWNVCACRSTGHCAVHDAPAWARFTDEQRRTLRAQVAAIESDTRRA